MKHVAYLLIAALCSFSMSVRSARGFPFQQTAEYAYSYEGDFEGWSTRAMDVWGASPSAWSIERSQDMAKDGNTSVKLNLVNVNDAEKIWIEKAFAVEPNQLYHVDVQYALASTEPSWDNLSAFTVITGVLPKSPQTRVDLAPAYKDITRREDSQSGYQWSDRKYEFAVRSNDQGVLYVVIGIWGTWEVRKTYYIDNVRVSLTKKPQGSEFFSFENDMEEWTSRGTDLDFAGGKIDWSIVRVKPNPIVPEDGSEAVWFDINSLNQKGKIWIERSFPVEPGTKYRLNLEYAFNSSDPRPNQSNRIISGVFRSSPQSADDLADAFQEDTSAGGTWGWLHKSYSFTIKSKKSRVLYVVIGIWGTQDDHKSYGFDSICVTLTPK